MLVNKDRLIATFRALVEIQSPTGQEANLISYVVPRLESAGARVSVDSGGNVIAKIDGAGEPILVCSHLDTVMPTAGLKIVERDGVFYSDGTTILGADDKSGIAVILEAVESLREQQVPHLPVEVVLTVAEEVGLVGAKTLDYSQIVAKRGLCLDTKGPIGTIIVEGPSQVCLDVTIVGKAAHAGMSPEKGISSIVVAAEAISSMPLGRIDEETTANVGVIQGGTATNIIPEKTTVAGEARSRDEEKLKAQVDCMVRAFQVAGARHGATVHVNVEHVYRAFHLGPNDEIVRMMSEAARKLGLPARMEAGGGGSDTNIFNERGIQSVNVSVGYEDPHSTSEHIAVDDLVRAAELLVAVLKG